MTIEYITPVRQYEVRKNFQPSPVFTVLNKRRTTYADGVREIRVGGKVGRHNFRDADRFFRSTVHDFLDADEYVKV